MDKRKPSPAHIHDQPSGKQTGSIDFEQRKDVHVCRGTQAGSMDNTLSLETQSFRSDRKQGYRHA